MRLVKKICWVALFCFSHIVHAVTIFEATYQLNWGIMPIGNVVRTLNKKNDTYTFVSDTKPVGLAFFMTDGIYEESVFKLSNNKLQEISYTIKEKNKNRYYHYVDNKLHITGDKNITLDNVADNSADYLSAIYAIMQGLKNQQNKFQFTIYETPNSPELFKFTKKSYTKITVPAGTFDTVLVEKVKTDCVEFKIWLATKYEFLPIKITSTNLSGHSFSMTLSDFK